MGERYTYGDTELAAERLGLVARVFEPTTRAFIERSVSTAPGLAYDLGCGPGLTTRLVHAATGAARTVGLDRSGPFLERAALGAPAVSRSVRTMSGRCRSPTARRTLIYCRLLLAHLVDPPGVVSRWTTQLAPGGLVLLDELEAIDVSDPVFAAYLGEVAIAVVEAQGARLLAGPVLAAMSDPPGTERVADDVVSFTPSRGRERADLRDEPRGARGARRGVAAAGVGAPISRRSPTVRATPNRSCGGCANSRSAGRRYRRGPPATSIARRPGCRNWQTTAP